jgi:circadian clock protein KaiC
MPEADLVKTGIKGFDEILFGGIPRQNIILVAGTAGTGKTTLGVEFVYRGARQFDEPGVIVLFEVAPDKLIRDAALFGWDLRELERDGRLKIVFTTRQAFQRELQRADSVLLAEAAEIGARRLFVDGLVRLPEPNGGDARDAFHLLAEGLHREDLTAMLALESTFPDTAAVRAPEEFVADTIVQLTIEPVQRAVLRSLEVVKSRGHEYALGRHSFRIVNGQGLDVYRRVQAPRSLQREGGAAGISWRARRSSSASRARGRASWPCSSSLKGPGAASAAS